MYVQDYCSGLSGLFSGFTGLFFGHRGLFCAVGSGDRLFVCICRARLQIHRAVMCMYTTIVRVSQGSFVDIQGSFVDIEGSFADI